MSGVQIHYTDAPITYGVSAVVVGGTFVDADQSGSVSAGAALVKTSGAASQLAVGVALTDAAPAGTDATNTTVQRPTTVAVARRGCVVPVKYSAASTFGDLLVTDSVGGVRPFVVGGLTPDSPAAIVGRNVDPAGKVVITAVGLVSIQ